MAGDEEDERRRGDTSGAGPSKTIAQQAVQGLKAEVKKGDKADEKAVGDWFNFLPKPPPMRFM